MNAAERLYGLLVWLYPAAHRREYGALMLLQARDLGRAAQQRGGWQVLRLCLRLLRDGLANAAIEQMEAIKMAKGGFQPAPWWSVALAVAPGVLMVFSRSGSTLLDIPLMVLGYLYLGLLLIGLPLLWRRQRQFPAWGLLPAGLLGWFVVYFAAILLDGLGDWLHLGPRWPPMERWLALLQVLLAATLLIVLQRKRRIPAAFWLVAGATLALNLVFAIFYSPVHLTGSRLLDSILTYFASAVIGPLEGFLLAGFGLLAVRQHGDLALLVVAGGYGYMLMDSDYLYGPWLRNWPLLTVYFIGLILLYMVVMPVAALRARSSLGRFLAVFLPVALFHAARIIVPMLVLPRSLPWGEVALSANVLLSLLLAWTLYRPAGRETRPVGEPLEAIPSAG